MSTKMMFFMFMIRLRRGFLLETLSYLFGIDTATVSRYCHFVGFVISCQLRTPDDGGLSYFRIRKGDELESMTPERTKAWKKHWIHKYYRKWFKTVENMYEQVGERDDINSHLDVHSYDCSYLYMHRPQDYDFQKRVYCDNKKRCVVKVATINACNGYFEDFVLGPGSFSDSRLWNHTTWTEKLEEIVFESGLKTGVGIVMDKGMDSLNFECPLIQKVSPTKKKRGIDKTRDEVGIAFEISSSRISIEQSYARMKSLRLLSKTLSMHDLPYLNDYVSCALYFCNTIYKPQTK